MTVADPESLGFTLERFHSIDEIIHQHIANDHVAGTVTLVARNGRVIYYKYKAHGHTDKEAEIPMRKDSRGF